MSCPLVRRLVFSAGIVCCAAVTLAALACTVIYLTTRSATNNAPLPRPPLSDKDILDETDLLERLEEVAESQKQLEEDAASDNADDDTVISSPAPQCKKELMQADDSSDDQEPLSDAETLPLEHSSLLSIDSVTSSISSSCERQLRTPFRTPTESLSPSLPQSYSNTSLHTLLKTQKLAEYELKARSAKEKEARGELEEVLAAYWRWLKARKVDEKRRSTRAEQMAQLAEPTYGRGRAQKRCKTRQREIDLCGSEREEREVKATKKRIEQIRERLRASKSLSAFSPRTSTSFPSLSTSPIQVHHLVLMNTFRSDCLTTSGLPSISPSHLLTILKDESISSTVKELDVNLSLWAGWDWDLDSEWDMEITSGRIRAQSQKMSPPNIEDTSPKASFASPSQEGADDAEMKKVALPRLTKLVISTADVPLRHFLSLIGDTPALEVIFLNVSKPQGSRRQDRGRACLDGEPWEILLQKVNQPLQLLAVTGASEQQRGRLS